MSIRWRSPTINSAAFVERLGAGGETIYRDELSGAFLEGGADALAPGVDLTALYYYDYQFRQLPPYQQHANADIDLRLATLVRELGLPPREAHDAVNDAVTAALAFIKLRRLLGGA